MIVAPRHLLTLICAFALLSLAACHERGGYQNLDDGGQTLPLQLPFQNLPPAMIGNQVNISIVATGGRKPYNYQFLPGGTSTIDPALQVLPTGFIFGTPSVAKNYKPIIKVTDADGQTAQQQYNLQIQNAQGQVPNTAPDFTGKPAPADTVHIALTKYEFQFATVDADGDPVQYNFLGLTERGGSPVTGTTPFIDATGKFSWDQMPVGTYDIQINATDGQNAPTVFRWCVVTYTPPAAPPLPCNQPPSVTLPTFGSAIQGQVFSFQASVNDPENDTITWQIILPGTGNIANGISVNPVAGNPKLAEVRWTPTFAQMPGNYPVTLRAEDTAANATDAQFVIQLLVGPPQPTKIRVWSSGFIAPTGAANAKQSDIRGIEELDPALTSTHGFTLGNTSKMLDKRDFGRGASTLALTGPKHNLRLGAHRAREVRLGTTTTYIQLPVYKRLDPNNAPQLIDVSGRLYHGTDEEVTNLTGANDWIAVFDTGGYARVFDFPTNIMEEIYVPNHFSEIPYFVVTSDDGLRMWICRLDGSSFSGFGDMMELNVTNIGVDQVMHQTVTGTLNRSAVGAGGPNFSHVNLWFGVDNLTGDDRLFRVAADATGPGMAPQATLVNLAVGGGAGQPKQISTYFAPSGDSRRVAIVAGDDMTTFINTVDSGTNLGKRRDIWMLDGELLTTKRVTEFENKPAAAGPNFRLIDCFDGSSTYAENFPNSMAGSDLGGGDRRVYFAENSSTANASTVGHTMNYDGTLVGFVLHEQNSGNTDGGSTSKHDEVYVAGVDSASAHDVIRVTAAQGATDTAGMRCDPGSLFNLNMGTCMGLAFPSLSGTKGRNTRLFFTYGFYTSGNLNEQGNILYSAEFTVSGTNDITHVSTVDRTTGNIAAPTGFEVPDSGVEYRIFAGSAEGAEDFADTDPANDTGVFTFIYFQGNTVVNTTGRLFWLDLAVENVNVSSVSTPTLLSPYVDNDGNPITVYRRNDDRTLYSSGRDQPAPEWGKGSSSSIRFPIHANLFADVPGPANATIAKTRAFVAVETAQSNETLYAFNMSVPNTFVVDVTNVATQGKIHEIAVFSDGDSVAIYKSASATAFQTERYGTTIQGVDIFVVPDVPFALNANAVPTMKTYSASSIGVSALGQFVGRGACWVNTSSMTGAKTREFWFAAGTSSNNNTTSYTTELTGYRIATTIVTGMAPQVAVAAQIDSMIAPADIGAVTFYGSGVR